MSIQQAFKNQVALCPKCKNMGYPYNIENNLINDTCEKCGSNLIHTKITVEERLIIDKISDDWEFLMAMVNLKENDPIEYQIKMSQFRTQVEQQKALEKQRQENNQPRCPHCHSTNIKPISALNRGTSIAMFGLFSKKINKSFECKNCGYTW